MGARTEIIDPEELCKDEPGIDTMAGDELEAVLKQRLNALIEGWNKNDLFITFPADPPPSGKIAFCLAPKTITTPQRLIVCQLLTKEQVDAIDSDKRDAFMTFMANTEIEGMEAANIRVDAHITFPDGNMMAIITDK